MMEMEPSATGVFLKHGPWGNLRACLFLGGGVLESFYGYNHKNLLKQGLKSIIIVGEEAVKYDDLQKIIYG